MIINYHFFSNFFSYDIIASLRLFFAIGAIPLWMEEIMSRLEVRKKSKAQLVVDNLYEDLERRIIASPPGLCPVDMTASFLKLFHAQTCGK